MPANNYLENAISKKQIANTIIIKNPDDPLALRISAGGNEKESYIVYRGDIEKIKRLFNKLNLIIQQYEESDNS